MSGNIVSKKMFMVLHAPMSYNVLYPWRFHIESVFGHTSNDMLYVSYVHKF